MERWQCIAGCGACCRLDPALRGEDLEALDPDQRRQVLEMVGPDGWCIHFDTGGRRCRIYDSRPAFCRVENLANLFGSTSPGHPQGSGGKGERERTVARECTVATERATASESGLDPETEALAIASCRCQIRGEYGGRGRVMKRFERAIRRQP